MPRIVIEGNIGCGKSTLLKALEKKGHMVFPEPIEEWGDILAKFYENKSRWSFAFQMKVLLSFLHAYPNECFVERSPSSCRYVFGQLLFSDNNLTEREWVLFKEYFDAYSWKTSHVIYIKTDSKTCLERIKQRERDGELSVGLAYLNKVEFHYDNMFKYVQFESFEVVDGNQSPEKVLQDVETIIATWKV